VLGLIVIFIFYSSFLHHKFGQHISFEMHGWLYVEFSSAVLLCVKSACQELLQVLSDWWLVTVQLYCNLSSPRFGTFTDSTARTVDMEIFWRIIEHICLLAASWMDKTPRRVRVERGGCSDWWTVSQLVAPTSTPDRVCTPDLGIVRRSWWSRRGPVDRADSILEHNIRCCCCCCCRWHELSEGNDEYETRRIHPTAAPCLCHAVTDSLIALLPRYAPFRCVRTSGTGGAVARRVGSADR